MSSWFLSLDNAPILIDCPKVTEEVINDLKELSGGICPNVVLTNRDAHHDASIINRKLDWPLIVQEQEAYLLPHVENLVTFSEELILSSGVRILWTPGPTPGSCVLHVPPPWNVLFCGRLLTPGSKDQISPIRTRSTFHWTMYQESLLKLRNWLPREQSPLLASGQKLHLLNDEKLLPWIAWKPSSE